MLLGLAVLPAAASAAGPGRVSVSAPGNSCGIVATSTALRLSFTGGESLGAPARLRTDYVGFVLESPSRRRVLFGMLRDRTLEHLLTFDTPAPLLLARTLRTQLPAGRYRMCVYGQGTVQLVIATDSGGGRLTSAAWTPVPTTYEARELPAGQVAGAGVASDRLPVRVTSSSVLTTTLVHLGGSTDAANGSNDCLARPGAISCIGEVPEPAGSFSESNGGNGASGMDYLPGEVEPGRYEWLIQRYDAGLTGRDVALLFRSE